MRDWVEKGTATLSAHLRRAWLFLIFVATSETLVPVGYVVPAR